MTGTEASAADSPESTAPEPQTRHGAPVTHSRGQEVLHPSRDTYVAVVEALTAEGYVLCADLTATDYLERPSRPLPDGVAPERFELVVNLVSMDPPRRTRLRVQVPEDDPSAPTLFRLFPGTEAMEREVYDLMGIRFTDHPDMTRILLPEDWEGHPLRKDYAIGKIPVQFKAAPSTR